MLVSMGKEVHKVTEGGWRPTHKSVEELAEGLEGKVDDRTVVIFMGLDNGTFYAENDEDGEWTLPKKDKEGKYHVEGRVQVASHQHTRSMWEKC